MKRSLMTGLVGAMTLALHLPLGAQAIAGAEPAAEPAPVAQPTLVVPAGPAREEKICQRVVPTGSIMAVKTCRTRRSWDGLAASGQENIRQLRDHAQATMGTPAD